MASTAVYTGSFDPITLGHLNVIQRSSRLFDQFIVGIGVNPDKKSLFKADYLAGDPDADFDGDGDTDFYDWKKFRKVWKQAI